jgi:hypothetical protein
MNGLSDPEPPLASLIAKLGVVPATGPADVEGWDRRLLNAPGVPDPATEGR